MSVNVDLNGVLDLFDRWHRHCHPRHLTPCRCGTWGFSSLEPWAGRKCIEVFLIWASLDRYFGWWAAFDMGHPRVVRRRAQSVEIHRWSRMDELVRVRDAALSPAMLHYELNVSTWDAWGHQARCAVCGEFTQCRNAEDGHPHRALLFRVRSLDRGDDVCCQCWSELWECRYSAIEETKTARERRKAMTPENTTMEARR